MGLKEATVGLYDRLLEWRVLMHPQHYLYSTEQNSAVRITMCTRQYVSIATNGITPLPYSSYRWLVCKMTTVGATASVNVDSPLQAVEWLLLQFVYYRLSHTREGMQPGDQENERYGVKANAAHHTHRSKDTL